MARKPPIGRSIGSLLPQITKKAMENFGFPVAALLTDWPRIAGKDLARFTAPERLRWPKIVDGDDDGGARKGATLVLRAEGPRALELQHQIPQLIERINAHFGFEAVTEIRLLQAPLPRAAPKRTEPPAAAPPLPIAKEAIPDDRLRAALERLGGEVRRHAAQTAAAGKPAQAGK